MSGDKQRQKDDEQKKIFEKELPRMENELEWRMKN